MSENPIEIIKSSGETALYEENLLRKSLLRSGAKEEIVTEIIDEIEQQLYSGISSKKIYTLAFKLLRKRSRSKAARYKLKNAILELGPTGFPFENFISKLMANNGYFTQTGIIAAGECITHEIDVVAYKENELTFVECKFHIHPESVSDIKVPLYIHSRFKDVEKTMRQDPENANKTFKYWIVTNTRFSSDALKYSECAGINLISWDYPRNGSLKKMIDQSGLHPITSLSSLTKLEKRKLLDKNIVLCKEIVLHPKMLTEIGVQPKKINLVLQEAKSLCEPCN